MSKSSKIARKERRKQRKRDEQLSLRREEGSKYQPEGIVDTTAYLALMNVTRKNNKRSVANG